MSDNEPVLGSFSQQSQEEPPNRMPMILGVLVVMALLGTLAFLSHSRGERKDQAGMAPADPYAANLVISDLKMSTAQNFAGGEVTYLEGKVENKGSRTMTGITVQVGFYNQLNELVQKDSMPLPVIRSRDPYIDTVSLGVAPLKPGGSLEFRLTFEHVSADWNRNYPEVRVIQVAGN
jgi:hypothetical protein